jgi:hypothetical protein
VEKRHQFDFIHFTTPPGFERGRRSREKKAADLAGEVGIDVSGRRCLVLQETAEFGLQGR